jgi:type III restriction enzyme
VVQKAGKVEVNWIIETKGRVWEGTEAKDESIQDWCQRVSKQTGQDWRFARVNQGDFDSRRPTTLAKVTQTAGW